MKLIIFLSILITIQAGVIKEDIDCDGITINYTYHDLEILHEDLDRPYLLAVDYSTNNLYFSYSVKVDEDEFRTARLNLNTKEFQNIEDVNNGFAQTVDHVTHDIYIGGSDGLYKYNYNNNKADFIGERGTNIWTVYFKDILYYSTFPSQFLYTFVDGQSNRFVDLEDTKVDNFVVDNDNVMFYTNNTGLYSQRKGTKDAVLYKEFPVIGIRGLTLDINGNVYACVQDGIYVVRKDTTSLEKVADIDDAFGLAFDSDNNIIYADARKLVRLKPNKSKNC